MSATSRLLGHGLEHSRRRSSPATPSRRVNPLAPHGNGFQHAAQVDLNQRMETALLADAEAQRPENTAKTMDNKVIEFFQYCDHVYAEDPYKCSLDYMKVYKFMFYHSFREAKARGGNKAAINAGRYFDTTDYDNVLAKFNASRGLTAESAVPSPTKGIGPASFSIYRAVMKKIYKAQIAQGVLNCHWDYVWQQGFDSMEDHVKSRAPRQKKETYQEKVATEFSPYTIVERYGEIEEELWNDSANLVAKRSVNAGLRHRYCLLHLTSGILRCESLHRAELSDFLGITIPKKDTDVHAMYVMVNQIAFGKTNH